MNEGKALPILALVACITLSVGTTAAHHSLSADYNTGAQISLEGTVREFRFVNPHPYINVDVTRNGRTQRWKMEMDNLSELTEIGMTSSAFRNGDRISVSGNPGRTATPILYIRRLDRPKDGFWYEQVGFEPKTGISPEVVIPVPFKQFQSPSKQLR